jgi:benzoyl-CoA reductase/2-hydroxyglutaryl-CoA dehydratase subunit BcrC/BadD/HgdB
LSFNKIFINWKEFFSKDGPDKENYGGKIAGIYCIYAPNELIRAAGIVPVGLCGKKQAPIKDAERELPASLCPLIKSSYGYAVTNSCPFFSFSDILVAETTCDGKKKMYELMKELKPLHLMHLPHTQEGDAALAYWMEGLKKLERFLFECSGITVTEKNLQHQIRQQNDIRKALWDISILAADRRSPLTAMEMLAVQ